MSSDEVHALRIEGEINTLRIERETNALRVEREDAVTTLERLFECEGVSPRIFLQIVEAAFMRGAWSGRGSSAVAISELHHQDRSALLARIDERRAREAADPEHQAFLARVEARRQARAAAEVAL